MLLTRAQQQAAAATPAWTPADLGAKLITWWDAEDLTTLTLVGSNVNAWRDKKTALSLNQGVSGSRPLWSATSFAGRPGIIFDGTDDFLSTNSIGTMPAAAVPGEMWALADQLALGSDTAIRAVADYGQTTANGSRRIRRVVASSISRGNVFANGTAATGSTIDLYGRHVIQGSFASTGLKISVDGAATETSAPLSLSTGNSLTSIGSNISGLQPWNGGINTVLITTVLTTDEAASLLAFLKSRGGI